MLDPIGSAASDPDLLQSFSRKRHRATVEKSDERPFQIDQASGEEGPNLCRAGAGS